MSTVAVSAASEVIMPRLSDSMEEGTVLKWLKAVGDQVELGEELVEIETDKANMVYESDAAGTLIEILAGEGDTVAIGEVIARLGEAGAAREANGAPATGQKQGPTKASPETRTKASPIARRLAREHDIDLAALAGSGPGGRIVKKDVEAALASGSASTMDLPLSPLSGDSSTSSPAQAEVAPETAKGTVEIVELTKLQQTVSRRMAESKATAPHFYLQANVDMTPAWDARGRIKAAASEGEVIPSFNDMVVKACAIALGEFPRANGAYRDGKWELYSRVNVGIAVAARDALVVPTVFDADQQGPAPDRLGVAGAGRARARADDHPARALGRHLHGLQPGHVRDLQLPPGDQLAPGGDPGGGGDHRDACGPRR